MFEDYRETNPTDLLEAPKIGRKLPDTLSEEEINELISAVDLSQNYFRNHVQLWLKS